MNKTVHFLDRSICKNSTLDDSRLDSGFNSGGSLNQSSGFQSVADVTRLSALSTISGPPQHLLGENTKFILYW